MGCDIVEIGWLQIVNHHVPIACLIKLSHELKHVVCKPVVLQYQELVVLKQTELVGQFFTDGENPFSAHARDYTNIPPIWQCGGRRNCIKLNNARMRGLGLAWK